MSGGNGGESLNGATRSRASWILRSLSFFGSHERVPWKRTPECIVGGSSGLWTMYSKQKPVCPMRVRSEPIRDGRRLVNRVNSALAEAGFFISSADILSSSLRRPRLMLLSPPTRLSACSRPRPATRESSNRPCGSSVQGASRVATGLIQLNRCEPPCGERKKERDRRR